jgi:hypothetical protein
MLVVELAVNQPEWTMQRIFGTFHLKFVTRDLPLMLVPPALRD